MPDSMSVLFLLTFHHCTAVLSLKISKDVSRVFGRHLFPEQGREKPRNGLGWMVAVGFITSWYPVETIIQYLHASLQL